MGMPGFTAEESVYSGANHYMRTAVRIAKGEVVHPQLVLPPWNRCSWLFFCCTEFGDQSCCQRWRLQCVPE